MPELSTPATAGLLVIDVQPAIDDPKWAAAGPRYNANAETNIARLLDCWRKSAVDISTPSIAGCWPPPRCSAPPV